MRSDDTRAVAVILLALLPAYCSIEGLVTGETRVLARHTLEHAGAAGIVTAISYGLFATALLIAAARYFCVNSKRRAALFKWGMNAMFVGVVLYFAGRFVWLAS